MTQYYGRSWMPTSRTVQGFPFRQAARWKEDEQYGKLEAADIDRLSINTGASIDGAQYLPVNPIFSESDSRGYGIRSGMVPGIA